MAIIALLVWELAQVSLPCSSLHCVKWLLDSETPAGVGHSLFDWSHSGWMQKQSHRGLEKLPIKQTSKILFRNLLLLVDMEQRPDSCIWMLQPKSYQALLWMETSFFKAYSTDLIQFNGRGSTNSNRGLEWQSTSGGEHQLLQVTWAHPALLASTIFI